MTSGNSPGGLEEIRSTWKHRHAHSEPLCSWAFQPATVHSRPEFHDQPDPPPR